MGKATPWFTAMVVIGLIFDFVVIGWERRDERSARRRWILRGFHPAEISSAIKFALEMLASAAILMGVAGELWIGVEITLINGKLRNLNANLRVNSDKLVALVEKETEDERMARLRIEKSMEWRHLSGEAKKALCRILPPQSAAALTVVVTNWDDPEPALYAAEFANTIGSCRPLPDAKTPRSGPKGSLSWTFPVRFGVRLEFSDSEARLARSLGDALSKGGVDISVTHNERERHNPGSPNRMIFVGPRKYPQSMDTNKPAPVKP